MHWYGAIRCSQRCPFTGSDTQVHFLFVQQAINMYEKLGYVVYRQVIDYYGGFSPEDAYDMRKACCRDVEKTSIIPLNPLRVHQGQFD